VTSSPRPTFLRATFYITDVIEPQDTRWMVALALRKILDKRELRPAKKHGNIPM
jgi:acetyl-CoA carboxylase carboxyltransferase component